MKEAPDGSLYRRTDLLLNKPAEDERRPESRRHQRKNLR